jgi:non-heme chloroperoxidase
MKEMDRDRREFLRTAGAAALALTPPLALAQGDKEDNKTDEAPKTDAAKPEDKPAPSAEVKFKEGSVTTDDGTELHYLEAGSGKPLVLIPGWSQSAAMFKHQLRGLSQNHRVIALDMRGHGESAKPTYGYRIQRLAADIRAMIYYDDLEDVSLLGHSMGCSVIWAYWDMFAGDRLAKIVLVDQAPTVVAQPGWSEEQKTEAGALFDPTKLYEIGTGLAGPDGNKVTEGFISPEGIFFSKAFPAEERAWVLKENLKLPRKSAADLLINHCTQDWRDVIPRISKPTLVIGAKGSFFTPKSQEWIGKQIKGSKVVIFEAEEGGSHFMFLENPEKFNGVVKEFLG